MASKLVSAARRRAFEASWKLREHVLGDDAHDADLLGSALAASRDPARTLRNDAHDAGAPVRKLCMT